MSLPDKEILDREPWRVEFQRVGRALRVFSSTNKTLNEASDAVTWLKQTCQTLIDVGGYRMAWVGFAEQDDEKTVRPVAYAGFEAGYLEAINMTWKDEPSGRSPIGISIRTGQPCIARNIPNDPTFDSWRKEIEQRGYGSCIALPLSGEGRTFGVLGIYAEEVDAFGPFEVEILKELGDNLAFGLTVALQTDVQSQSVAEALKESQRKLGQAEQITHLAQWSRDLKTNILTWSDELYRILGFEPQEHVFHFSEFIKLVHPDDRAGVAKAADEAVDNFVCFDRVYRVVRPDGQLRFIHGKGEVIRDNDGRPLRSVGFLQDVTAYREAKAALENANVALAAKNIAMQEVLSNIEAERDKIGEQVNKNVTEIILPLLQSLKQGATRQQQHRIDQIEKCLQDIISPFIAKISHAVNSLTPAELRICSFIKRGLGVKQIAELEHLSPETVSAHRRNIRRKLQIAHRKINLTSYLRSIFTGSS